MPGVVLLIRSVVRADQPTRIRRDSSMPSATVDPADGVLRAQPNRQSSGEKRAMMWWHLWRERSRGTDRF